MISKLVETMAAKAMSVEAPVYLEAYRVVRKVGGLVVALKVVRKVALKEALAAAREVVGRERQLQRQSEWAMRRQQHRRQAL